MKCPAVMFLAAACLCGCNSTQPTFNPLAPYGSSRVPPPSTNQLGAGPGYYQNPSVPRTAVPTIRANSGTPSASVMPSGSGQVAASGTWKPAEGAVQPAAGNAGTANSGVAAASFTASSSPAGASTPNSGSASTLNLKGMPVNDATNPAAAAEPAAFQPMPSASPISPQPTAAPQSAALPPAAAAGSGIVVATARSSDAAPTPAPPANATASQSSLQWRDP